MISDPYLISTGSEDSLVFSQLTGCSNFKDIPVTLNTLFVHLPRTNQMFRFLHYAGTLPPYRNVLNTDPDSYTLFTYIVRMLSRNYANADQGALVGVCRRLGQLVQQAPAAHSVSYLSQ